MAVGSSAVNIPLLALLVGSPSPLGDRGIISGIQKFSINRRLKILLEGLEGDTQCDRRRHGGVYKAVHHYAFEHYATWSIEIGMNTLLRQPGAFGENLSTIGVTEETVALGDIFRLGGAVLQVSQGRQPCFKLNLRFGIPDMAWRVQNTRRTGWYYRVLQEGYVEPGDRLVLVDRILPNWPLARLSKTLFSDTLNRDELAEMASLAILPESWRDLANRRLEFNKVEEWEPRLSGKVLE